MRPTRKQRDQCTGNRDQRQHRNGITRDRLGQCDDDCLRAVEKKFPKGKLVAVHPNGGHDFLPEIRKQAWAFVDKQLVSDTN